MPIVMTTTNECFECRECNGCGAIAGCLSCYLVTGTPVTGLYVRDGRYAVDVFGEIVDSAFESGDTAELMSDCQALANVTGKNVVLAIGQYEERHFCCEGGAQ